MAAPIAALPLEPSTSPPDAPLGRVGEAALVEGLQAGDEAAFRALFEAYYEPLVAFARRHLPTLELAEEAVQDVLVSLWRRGRGWRLRGALRPYLYSAVRRRCADVRGRRANAPRASLDAVPAPEAEATADDALRYQELRHAVQQAVDALPERRRLVFVLSRYQGLTYAEIAAVLGISAGTVEVQMVRALKTLRSRLAPFLSAALCLL